MTKICVVGGGISGLSCGYLIEQMAQEKNLEIELTLLESESSLGGKIRSQSVDGYLLEWGPNGFLDSKPWTLELCDKLGLSEKLLASNDAARKRFIFSEGRLHRLPEGPSSFFLSSFLSLRGRLRIVGELWAKKRPDGVDESLADFARRRLGVEAYEKLLDPMVSGIFAGNPEEMSLKSCFPRIAELERDYGGLIRAMLALQSARRKKQKAEAARGSGKRPKAGPSGPGGVLTSFKGGLGDLVHALQNGIKGELRSDFRVKNISHSDGGFTLRSDKAEIDADMVILAVPAYEAAEILKEMEPDAAAPLAEIPYSPLAIVALGVDPKEVAHALDGFGFLIPSREKRKILGALWTSSIFSDRSPEGKFLIRTMIGGARNPDMVPFDIDRLVSAATDELGSIMGLGGEPSFVKVIPHEKAIPHYTIGHEERLNRLEKALQRRPGLYVTGNACRGIGLNDCVKSSMDIVERVSDFLEDPGR